MNGANGHHAAELVDMEGHSIAGEVNLRKLATQSVTALENSERREIVLLRFVAKMT